MFLTGVVWQSSGSKDATGGAQMPDQMAEFNYNCQNIQRIGRIRQNRFKKN